jgi:tRNA A64-2'-O-ribosylphosphate transferase
MGLHHLDNDDDATSIPPPGGLPPGRALRELRRRNASPFYAAASAAADSDWVATVAMQHQHLPLFANLRCGAWHVAPPAEAARFKSTDGHAGAARLPLDRLNLAFVRSASSAGGAVLVDATRRGKSFPDALSRTVPVWAAVLNAAAASVKGLTEAEARTGGWRSLRLPPWVPASEAASLAARVPAWAGEALASGADVRGVVAELRHPFAPVWVCRAGETVAENDSGGAAATIRLVLVSASDPSARRASVAGPGYEHFFDYVAG